MLPSPSDLLRTVAFCGAVTLGAVTLGAVTLGAVTLGAVTLGAVTLGAVVPSTVLGSTPSGPTIGGERGHPSQEQVDADYLARRWAGTDLAGLAAALEACQRDTGDWPESNTFAELERYLAPTPQTDPWGTGYRFDFAGVAPRVLCAGPDRVFGTADDLWRSLGDDEPSPPAEVGTPPTATWLPPAPPPAPLAPEAPPTTPEVRLTHQRLLGMADALGSFRRQRGHYPVVTGVAELRSALVPEHVEATRFADADAWGHPWRYRSNDLGTSYTLVSAGADGRFETLVPLRSGAVADPDRDLVLADGAFVRWPAAAPEAATAPPRAGTFGFGVGTPPARPPAPATVPRRSPQAVIRSAKPAATSSPEVGETGKSESTRRRFRQLAAELERHRKNHGRYPEFDDANRLKDALGLPTPPEDGWGRRPSYLTLAGGSRYVLASGGSDGRLDHPLEAYLRGAAPGTGRRADIVLVNGNLLD